jgi:hypothetical protein
MDTLTLWFTNLLHICQSNQVDNQDWPSLLQTCFTHTFVYDQVWFCVYFIFWIYPPYMRENMQPLSFWIGGRKERKRECRVNNIEIHCICAGRGYNGMYWKLLNDGGGTGGVRESNGRGWTDQSKLYSQWGYIEKPLCTLNLELGMKNRIVK